MARGTGLHGPVPRLGARRPFFGTAPPWPLLLGALPPAIPRAIPAPNRRDSWGRLRACTMANDGPRYYRAPPVSALSTPGGFTSFGLALRLTMASASHSSSTMMALVHLAIHRSAKAPWLPTHFPCVCPFENALLAAFFGLRPFRQGPWGPTQQGAFLSKHLWRHSSPRSP